jgi:hypothetical protein
VHAHARFLIKVSVTTSVGQSVKRIFKGPELFDCGWFPKLSKPLSGLSTPFSCLFFLTSLVGSSGGFSMSGPPGESIVMGENLFDRATFPIVGAMLRITDTAPS